MDSVKPEIINEKPRIELYLGDCLEIMKQIPDKSIDLVLTDPPYGVKKAEWDDIFPLKNTWEEIKRIMTDRASILIFPGEKNLPQKINTLSDVFIYQWVLVWYKPNAMQFGKTGYTKHSLIHWYSKTEKYILNKGLDIIIDNMGQTENKSEHPSPKNIKVIEKIASMFSNETDTILDPFMGSGTTLVAAKELGRNAIGIEIEPKYYEIAKRRINNAITEMFVK